MNEALETMRGLTFGIEIETVGASRRAIAHGIALVIGGTASDERAGWVVRAPDGRKWQVVSDGSLTDASGLSGEIVSPICTLADMEMVQRVVRAIRASGASVNRSCGIHVHVGAAKFDGPALVRLAKLAYQQEPLIFAALGVQSRRQSFYTRPVEDALIQRLAQMRPTNPDAVLAAWYGSSDTVSRHRTAVASGSYDGRVGHYHDTRYHGLNLHAVLDHGTIEFRYFESTLHAGEVRTYVQFCLALAAKAILSKSAVARKRTFNPATAKYDFRVFLLRLGMIGDEFKTARGHLMKKLQGSASWKNGRPVAETAAPPPETAAIPNECHTVGYRSPT